MVVENDELRDDEIVDGKHPIFSNYSLHLDFVTHFLIRYIVLCSPCCKSNGFHSCKRYLKCWPCDVVYNMALIQLQIICFFEAFVLEIIHLYANRHLYHKMHAIHTLTLTQWNLWSLCTMYFMLNNFVTVSKQSVESCSGSGCIFIKQPDFSLNVCIKFNLL